MESRIATKVLALQCPGNQKRGAPPSAERGAPLSLLRSNVMRAVRVNLAGSRPSRRRFTEREFPCGFLSTPLWPIRWPAPTRVGSFFLVSLLGRHGPGLRRALPERCCRSDGAWAMRPFATGSHPQRPCICRESWRGHGGATHRRGLLRRNRTARQISPTCGLPREANFSGLPVLHCVAAPPLRFGMRRARTLTHRITPRPRWARPG